MRAVIAVANAAGKRATLAVAYAWGKVLTMVSLRAKLGCEFSFELNSLH